jgi:hypothetical protein
MKMVGISDWARYAPRRILRRHALPLYSPCVKGMLFADIYRMLMDERPLAQAVCG